MWLVSLLRPLKLRQAWTVSLELKSWKVIEWKFSSNPHIPKSFLKLWYFLCMTILSTGILCSNPDSYVRSYSPRTTVHRAGSGRLNMSLWTQWAAESTSKRTKPLQNHSVKSINFFTQYLWIKTPPHQCPINPNEGCNSSNDACHLNSPSLVGVPYIIFGFRDAFELIVLLLLFCLTASGKKVQKINNSIKIYWNRKKHDEINENNLLINHGRKLFCWKCGLPIL